MCVPLGTTFVVNVTLLAHPAGGERSSEYPSTSDCAGFFWANASADLGEKRGQQLVSELEPALKKCAATESEDCCVLENSGCEVDPCCEPCAAESTVELKCRGGKRKNCA